MSLWISLHKNETCPNCGHVIETDLQVHDQNITHNLGEMARHAGFYKAVWRAEENGIETAKDIIPFLEKGIRDMKNRPDYYKQFSAENGWGTYEQFLPWLDELLGACKEYPDASVHCSR